MSRTKILMLAAIAPLLLVSFVPPAPPARALSPDPPPTPRFGRLPLAFEPSLGRAGAGHDFLARGTSSLLLLGPVESTLYLRGDAPATLSMRFAGGSADARARPESRLPGVVNLLRGRDPAAWRTGVPTFARIRYDGVYPGIDVVHYGRDRRFEFDLVVDPGADPGAAALAFGGADSLDLTPEGDLVLGTAAGKLTVRRPVAWQDVEGVRREVPARYVLDAARHVRFEVGTYDVTRTLVIDPVLECSTYLGSSGHDRAHGVAVDARGRAYLVGQTWSSGLVLAPGANAGASDAFVTKLHESGMYALYTTYLGGSDVDSGWAIALDRDGSAIVTGGTDSTDFPLVNPVHEEHGGSTDLFVAKLSPDGSRLVYSSIFGGRGIDGGLGVAVDREGCALVTGTTYSSDFPVHDALQPTYAGGWEDIVLLKLDPEGALRFATFIGGSHRELGRGIALDRDGNAYLCGETMSTDLPVVNPAQGSNAGGYWDAFVMKVAGDGSEILYSTYLGGRSRDQGESIAVDRNGRATVVGFTTSPDFPTERPIFRDGRGGRDAFVTRLSPSGALDFSTFFGGRLDESAWGVAVDDRGILHVAGQTQSVDYPQLDPVQPGPGGGCDAFVTRFDADEGAVTFSTYLGGEAEDIAEGIAVDPAGDTYVAGRTTSGNFPLARPLQPTYSGDGDAFAAKISDRILVTIGSRIEVEGEFGRRRPKVWLERRGDGRKFRLRVLEHSETRILAEVRNLRLGDYDLRVRPRHGKPVRMPVVYRAERPSIAEVAPTFPTRPTMADLFGSGFGARPGIVRVAGRRAEIVEWTDTWVIFRMPPSTPAGPVDVVLWNRIGRVVVEDAFTIVGD